MIRTYRYRIYPTRRQTVALEEQLRACCDLYNAALEQRREWWKRGRRASRFAQNRQLTEARRGGLLPEGLSVRCQEDVLKRVDRAYAAFFRRVASGRRPGFPRFRSIGRYDSLTWRGDSGALVRDGRLRVCGIGDIKVRWHRELPTAPKETTVRRTAGKWFACFTVEHERTEPLPATGESVGIDLGITTFAALSSGELLAGPRAFKAARRDLRRAQRRLARRRRGSQRREKAREQVAARHARIREVRRDHRHKVVLDLVRRFDTIYVEDLNVAGLGRGILARDSLDQGWAQFLTALRAKAEWAGREVVAVDPRGTSQRCSECGEVVPKDLGVRVHQCKCGYVANRDVNAARNVLLAGRASQALTGTVSVA